MSLCSPTLIYGSLCSSFAVKLKPNFNADHPPVPEMAEQLFACPADACHAHGLPALFAGKLSSTSRWRPIISVCRPTQIVEFLRRLRKTQLGFSGVILVTFMSFNPFQFRFSDAQVVSAHRYFYARSCQKKIRSPGQHC